jgi:hypothetical protein
MEHITITICNKTNYMEHITNLCTGIKINFIEHIITTTCNIVNDMEYTTITI